MRNWDHALARDVDCTIEALQRVSLPGRTGTTGKPVRLTERPSSPGTVAGRDPGSEEAQRAYRSAAGPHRHPPQPDYKAWPGKSPLQPRSGIGPARKACGSPITRTRRNRLPPTGLAGLPTDSISSVPPGSRAEHCQTCNCCSKLVP